MNICKIYEELMNLTLNEVVINEFVRFSNATPYRGVLHDMHIVLLQWAFTEGQ